MHTPEPPPPARAVQLAHIERTLADMGRHLIRFGEQLRAAFGAISTSFAAFLGVAPRLSRTQLRLQRVRARPNPRARRTERRRRQRVLRHRRHLERTGLTF